MLKLRKHLTKLYRKPEQGSDVVTTLFMIPITLGLIFALIDVSSYFQARSSIQSIVRDGARQVALYGGQSFQVALNETGNDVAVNVKNRLWDNGNCVVSGCTEEPIVVCGPNIATSLNDDAFCRVEYAYRSYAGGLVDWLGFGAILNPPFTIEESFKTETKY